MTVEANIQPAECPPGGYFIMINHEQTADHCATLTEARQRGKELCDAEPLPSTWSIADADGEFVEEIKRSDGKTLEVQIMEFSAHQRAHNRYALVSVDADAGRIWSVDGAWSASLLSNSPTLLTGPQADALLSRHPKARIVDVVIYREALAAYNAGANAVIDHGTRSTTESRQAARDAGQAAMVRAGFHPDALNV